MDFYRTSIENIGDPFVLKYQDMYYVYATSSSQGFMVWQSEDLKNFAKPVLAYQMTDRSFGYKDFWAPEVVYHNNQFVMHYTARDQKTDKLLIGVATSKSPMGPFIDVYDKSPMFDFGYAAIDGNAFINPGQNYFYYVRDCSMNIIDGKHISEIYVAKLSDDLYSVKDPIKVLTPSAPYELDDSPYAPSHYWNEGPFMLKHEDIYYLMYSINFYRDPKYAICVATSKTPQGPFHKYDEPLIDIESYGISGPGHNMCLWDQEDLLCVYHIHTDANLPSGNRTMCYSRFKFVDGKLTLLRGKYDL